jgi:plasmid stabilization system protein ParE
MKIRFLVPARSEFDEAADHYNAEEPGLGDEFVEEVKKTIQRIVDFPDAWTLISTRTRRCRTRRFPYGVLYQIRGDTLLIVGVMHLHRSPNSWRSRLSRGED